MKRLAFGRFGVCFAAGLLGFVCASGMHVTRADDSTNPSLLFQNFTLNLANAQTGTPVHGARVTFFRSDTGAPTARYTSDSNGQAAVRLDPGTYRFTAIKTGYRVERGVATLIPSPSVRSAACLNCDVAVILMKPGITDVSEDISLCTDFSDPLQTATTYVVCNGSPF